MFNPKRVTVKSSAVINDSTTISILSISPLREDHGALEAILCQDSGASFKLKIYAGATLEHATALLQLDHIPIVICETDLPHHGSWKEMLEQTAVMHHSPLLIVTSRLADERLWAEALNLGAWDVLAKPFNRTEVIRVVESAWRHWHDHHQSPARASGTNLRQNVPAIAVTAP